jgi:hypothetical protein
MLLAGVAAGAADAALGAAQGSVRQALAALGVLQRTDAAPSGT